MNKKIDFILKGREKSIGEETILQPLPHKDFRFASPFIVLHHLPPRTYAPGSPPERIHPHPHRGFAPVTFQFQGEGYHKDSLGNSGYLKAGEVQWMFAGKGLLHSEGPSKEFLAHGGTYEFVQLWVNVPARYKGEVPWYKQAAPGEMPLMIPEKGVELRLACGNYGSVQGPLISYTPIVAAFGSVDKDTSFSITATEGYWTLLYILDGKLQVNEQEVQFQHLIIFNKSGSEINIKALTGAKVVYLSGEPIEEPVAAKGNIVMNTAEEVQQAEQDYAEGRFGVLED
ncbi:MAG TPA: pirin-like C-terminal cupin domain-containing protein [Flavisolibacter sp.]|nr:pirin-like C-terminal cupin domain-containing protein [Flavisolibacter sp.]